MVLNHNVWKLILSKLSYPHLIKLMKVGIEITDTMAEEIGVKLIKQRLNKVGIDAEEFCQKMKENGCFMAGSFPLQSVLGEEWQNSDIDIYKMTGDDEKPKEEDFREYEEVLDYFPPKYYVDGFERYLFDKYTVKKYDKTTKTNLCFYKDKDYDSIFIKGLRNYTLDNITVQFIQCNKERYNSIENFLETFDLDLCKIMFDGERLYLPMKWYMMTLKKMVWINGRRNAEERCLSFFSPRSRYFNRLRMRYLREVYDTNGRGRIEKYESRGFEIMNKSEYDLFIRNLLLEYSLECPSF